MTTVIPEMMTAYRYHPGQPVQPVAERVKVPTAKSDEVLVKILAGGDKARKFTVGHEGSGVIVSLGSDVSSTNPELTVGAYVAMYIIDSCFKSDCYYCSHGLSGLCTYSAYGLNLDGFWAAYAVVRAACVVLVPGTPETIPPGVISTATDAIVTPYHAMKSCCGLQPHHTVLCIGIGGLGYNAVGIAKKCLGVQCVIACDVRELALANVKEAGADYVTTPDRLAKVIEENNLCVDFAFDFVGSQATFDLCFASIRKAGTIHVLGLASAELNAPPLKLMAKEVTYRTSCYGSKEELKEVLQAIADGVLRPKVEPRPMEEVVQVLKDMHDGNLKGRVALLPEYD